MSICDIIQYKASRHILLASFLCLILACSCRSIKYVPVQSQIDSVVVEKPVEVHLPPDSSTIYALLECDKNGKVLLKQLDIVNSKNAQAQLTIDSLGNLKAQMKTKHDTVYIPSKTITITKKEQVPYPVEKELSQWQNLCIKLGGWAFAVIIIGIIFIVKKVIDSIPWKDLN